MAGFVGENFIHKEIYLQIFRLIQEKSFMKRYISTVLCAGVFLLTACVSSPRETLNKVQTL